MPPQIPLHIFGMHDAGAEHLFSQAGKTGWVVITVKVSEPAGDYTGLTNAGLGVIVRLNNGYEPDGTIPHASQYDQFAQQCANFVAQSQGAKIWIIGNETNLAGERPGGPNGQVITPDLYAQCFAKCRKAIKQVPGHADDWVVTAAPAPWNAQTTYPGNPAGDWVKYGQDLWNQCVALGQKPDAIALHTYAHGMNPALITSERKMDPPFDKYRSEFRAYRDYLAVIPTALKTVPVLITETQAANPDWWQNTNTGWIQAAYKEINDWNAVAANQPIQALVLFRWQTGEPQWSIADKPALHGDFLAAMQNNYKVRMPQPVTTPPQPQPQPQPQPPTSGPPSPNDPAAIAALDAAKKLTWMPINTDAALYKFAQSKNLGYPQTDEFKFMIGNDEYIGQVFNLGIVYVKKNDWANIKFVRKPEGI